MRQITVLLAIVTGVLFTGCVSENLDESKSASIQQWSNKRAEMLYTIASGSYRSGKLDQAEERARQAADLDPENMSYRILLARIYIDSGQYSKAEVQLAEISQKMPESPDISYLMGIVRERQGRLTEAFESFATAARLDVQSSDAVVAAAEVLVSCGDTEKAWEYLEPRLDRADKNPAAHELAGRLSMMLAYYDRAVGHFHEARLMDIQNQAYPVMLAEAYYYSGNCIEALKWLDQVRAAEKYQPRYSVETIRGDCLMVLGQPQNALKAYRMAADVDKTNPDIWNSIAKACLVSNDLPEAVRAAGFARTLQPQDLDAALLLATALIRQKNYPEALRVLCEAGTIHPRKSLIYSLRGKACEQMGNTSEAESCYAMARRLSVDAELPLSGRTGNNR